MKIQFKPLYLSFALAIVLFGCGSTKMVSTPVENIDKMPLKTTPLKEKDLQRWSHLDLVKDTVPGMSVDKAYAEVLKKIKQQKRLQPEARYEITYRNCRFARPWVFKCLQ